MSFKSGFESRERTAV